MGRKRLMARSTSSNTWLREHVNDQYVQMAKKDGYRARAAYKLLEINEKDKLIRPGTVLADLGSAPGSWSQVAARIVGPQGKVFALDILPMNPIADVDFIQGDFREDEVLAEFVDLLDGRALDLVISDMAPNISGMSAMDQARSFLLCELALEFARDHLKPGGSFLVKVFQGSDFQSYLQSMRDLFDEVLTRKPKASRDRSSEIYLLGKGRR
ncbi:23S rRNA (uridine(2552)-2'-O)-methyltransferase RlmE [Aquitalea sp.]|uniref:23S rRNA (uridine(2552)-2'-O)-methyltransferase RlmE n=1 Tax=Aquitalea sp. TaxID=1872623 RepID=UPI00258756CE|nr:23S rRNA (uridine(2552)-2'-O)-methyltransferase RlmE [Aquitalea sp.]